MRTFARFLTILSLFFLFPSLSIADEIFAMSPPCRVLDTRQTGGGGPIAQGTSRHFFVRGTPGASQGGDVDCGVPLEATAVVVTVGVVGPSAAGWVVLYTWAAPPPYATVVTIPQAGATFAVTGSTMMKLPPGTPVWDLSLHFYSMTGHAVVDLVGYLQ